MQLKGELWKKIDCCCYFIGDFSFWIGNGLLGIGCLFFCRYLYNDSFLCVKCLVCH